VSDGSSVSVIARRLFWKLLAGSFSPLALLFVSGQSVSAQSPSGFGGDLNPLFQGILTRPSDLNNTLQYAALAPSSDVEAAISTYEQLLFYNPHLAAVRFELGVLYYRLGSYEMAHEYFATALKMPDMTPDLRQRTEDLLAAVDKKLLPDQFSGYVQTGVRYQTNAATGPSPQIALPSGLMFNNQFAARPDANWFGAFGLNYVHDFENQRGDTFEANAIGYDAQQFTLHQFDIGQLEFRAGPRFGIPTASPTGLSVKPYVVAVGGVLADVPYYGSLGGGLTVHWNVGNVAFDPYFEIAQQSFRNLTLYPLASGMNGMLQTYGLQASGPVYASLGFQTRVVYAHADAAFNPYGYDSYAADIWLPWNFSPLGDGRTWTLTPTAGFTQWQYNAPDPAIDPLTTPHILEWRVGLGLEFPIWDKILLATLVQYRADLSNISAFAMHDFSVAAGPTFRF
jgi:tetratricopeptide (TPR) repeat protein